jgi:Tfp pilus assembly protein PilF
VSDKSGPADERAARSSRGLAVLLGAVALVSLIYLPTLKYGFVWDDQALIVQNQDLARANPLAFFAESFTHWWAKQGLVPDAYYRPLVMLSFWLDARIWGQQPLGFHLTNVILNLIAALLVAVMFRRLLGRAGSGQRFWAGLLAGLLFALHPMHVESVAFVAGRTDVLMTIFLALALLELMPGTQSRNMGSVPGLFALALLCKEAAILFPLLVLLLPGPAGPVKRKRLVLVVVLVAVALGYLAARALVLKGVATSWGDVTLVQRMLLVLNAIGRYTALAVVPFRHRLSYPDLAQFAWFGWPSILGLVSLAGLVLVAVRFRRTLVGMGAAWFLLFLLPSCNFFPPGPSYLSERLLYLPSTGLILAGVAAAGLVRKVKTVPTVMAIAGFASAVLMTVSIVGWLPHWREERTLLERMVLEVPGSSQAHAGLAEILKEQRDNAGAIREYGLAVKYAPDKADLHYQLGMLLDKAGDKVRAEQELWAAVKLDPKLADAHNLLGNLQIERGDAAAAIASYRQAIALEPRKAVVHNNLGVALQSAQDPAGAEREFRQAVALDPKQALALNNLGEVLMHQGRNDSALALFQQAVTSDPNYPLARYNLGLILKRTGQVAAAAREFQRVLELVPDFAPARAELERR